jgi:hypothetical protein
MAQFLGLFFSLTLHETYCDTFHNEAAKIWIAAWFQDLRGIPFRRK